MSNVGKSGIKLHRGQMEVFYSPHRFKVVVAGRRWGKCLATGTMISMADGSEKPVEEVNAGDLVLTVNEDTYKIEPKPVLHLHDNGIKETVVVSTASRSLRCTPNHPLLVNNKWVEAKDIKPGDLVAIPKDLSNIERAYLPIRFDAFVVHLLPNRSTHGIKPWQSKISVNRYNALRDYTDGYFDPIADGDVAWEEVKSVTPADEVQTWDLSIEGNHNFIAEGIVTHNTALSRTKMIKIGGRKKARVWYIAPTFRMAKQIMWNELVEAVPTQWIKNINHSSLTISLVNGSELALRGADRPDTLRGVALDYVILDEFQDMKADVWKKVIRPTLSSTGGGALIIGTPKSFNYLYELFMLGQEKEMQEKGQWKSWQFKTSSSPFIPLSEIEAAKKDMDIKSFQQEYEASFSVMSGRVYYPFSRETHVGNYPFNPMLPIWVGQDFNIDPMSSAILQPQPNGEVWVVDEIVLPSSNTEETCSELDRKFWRQQSNVVIYPDPAGSYRQHARGETDLDIFRERGFKRIKYRRKHPSVADRINAVNSLLMAADGTIRLKVNSSCHQMISSLEQTLYKEGCRDIDKAAGVEHITDALGYPIEIEFPMNRRDVIGISI